MPQSAGHLIVRQLEAQGVQRVYSVPGESFLDVLDGLYDSPINTVVARHEGGAGFMALAESRLTGTPGVAMVTRGPGAANAMISLHTAWQDATALVLFVGLIPLADRGRGAFQEFDLAGWFATTAKKVLVLDDEDQAADVVADAMRTAASGRPGPVVVGLPEDVLVRITDSRPVSPPPVAPGGAPSGAAVAVAERLAAAERPLIVVGGDGWDSDTGPALLRWAAEAQVPVAADWRAYDAVPHDSPAWAGWLGYGRADTLARRLDEADLLVFLGSGRSDVMSDGYTRGFGAETILIVPDADAAMHAGRIDRHIVAAPSPFVAALPPAGTARGERGNGWMAALAADQQRFTSADFDGDGTAGGGSDGVNDDDVVDLRSVFGTLERLLPAERVITYGAGNTTLWGHRYLSHNRPHSLVAPRNGAMGLAVPAAVAASLVFPKRQAVAICGDGDFMMNPQELSAAFTNGTTPLVIVVDNGIYATIVDHQRAHYPGRPSGTSAMNPDFAAGMRSFGGHGETVARTEEFEPALARALSSGLPALVHVQISADTSPPPTDNAAPAGQATAGHAAVVGAAPTEAETR